MPMKKKETFACPLTTNQIVDRIILFTETLTRVKLYTYQSLFARRVIASLIDGDGATITDLQARQSGKTESVANMCLGVSIILPILAKEFPKDSRFMQFARGVRVGIYAPIDSQASLPYERMRGYAHSENGIAVLKDPEINISIVVSRGDRITFSNGSVILSKTASPHAQIEGETHNLVILEEAQRLLRSKVEKEIKPFLAATNGTLVKIGTAWESRGGFHQSIQQNIETHMNGGKRSHFEFPYNIIIEEKRHAFEKDGNPFHLNYEKFVENELTKSGGEDTEEFRMNFKCLWQESRIIAVNKAVFESCAAVDLEAFPHTYGCQVAGLDIGKVQDSTVLTVMAIDIEHPIVNPYTLYGAEVESQIYHNKTIFYWKELGGAFEGNTGQYRALIEAFSQLNIKVLVIDATSIGDPIFERISELVGSSMCCIPYKFNSATKSVLYKNYLQELHAKRVFYAAGHITKNSLEYKKFCQEHIDLDRSDYGGYAVCGAPLGCYDDYPDSAALACWGEKILKTAVMPEVQVTSSMPTGKRQLARYSSDAPGTNYVESTSTSSSRYARRW